VIVTVDWGRSANLKVDGEGSQSIRERTFHEEEVPEHRAGQRKYEDFVDNTKTFVLSCAHGKGTTTKANGFGAGNPACAV